MKEFAIKFSLLLLLGFLVAVYGSRITIPAVQSQQATTEDPKKFITDKIQSGEINGWFPEGNRFLATDLINFYAQRDFQPAWIAKDSVAPQADSLIAALENAPRDGLFADYNLAEIRHLRDTLFDNRNKKKEPEKMALLDLKLTASYLLLASHLANGQITSGLPPRLWQVASKKINYSSYLQEAIALDNIPVSLQRLSPDYPQYNKLKEALHMYMEIRKKGGWARIPSRNFLPGIKEEEIAIIKKRLISTGYLGKEALSLDRIFLYDEETVRAVKRFQKNNGLNPDGIISAKTRDVMNIPVGDRIKEVAVNMERYRWMPSQNARNHLDINLPSVGLMLLSNGDTMLQTNILIGKKKYPTPVFADAMVSLTFNPTWKVPRTVVMHEIVPKMRESINYADRHDYTIYSKRNGKRIKVDPRQIPWQIIPADEFPYIIVQDAGESNYFGRLKFNFAQNDTLTIHSTGSPEIALTTPMQTYHTIAAENTISLATMLLPEDFSERDVREKMFKNISETVTFDPVPALVTYFTTRVDENGLISHFEDIYEYDKLQIEQIQLPPLKIATEEKPL